MQRDDGNLSLTSINFRNKMQVDLYHNETSKLSQPLVSISHAHLNSGYDFLKFNLAATFQIQ